MYNYWLAISLLIDLWIGPWSFRDFSPNVNLLVRIWDTIFPLQYGAYIFSCHLIVFHVHILNAAGSPICLHVRKLLTSCEVCICSWWLWSCLPGQLTESLEFSGDNECKVCFGIIWSQPNIYWGLRTKVPFWYEAWFKPFGMNHILQEHKA